VRRRGQVGVVRGLQCAAAVEVDHTHWNSRPSRLVNDVPEPCR
jgi:hypothetical protein